MLKQIRQIDEKYGPKRNLMLMDNNILCSPQLEQIADDIVALGFDGTANYVRPNAFAMNLAKIERRIALNVKYYHLIERTVAQIKEFSKRIVRYENVAKEFNEHYDYVFNAENKLEALQQHKEYFVSVFDKYSSKTKMVRYVDCNQGIDARLINKKTIAQLAKLPIRPFRLAFDDIKDAEIFQSASRMAIDNGFTHFSNYMLYNWKDEPTDLWKRLNIAVTLYNQKEGLSGFSFPMKFAPINETSRNFVGEKWSKKQLRAINVIINVTRGVVAKERDFFEEAFGKNEDEFLEILMMPDEIIRYRHFFRDNGILAMWLKAYRSLSEIQKNELVHIVSEMVENPSILNLPCSEPVKAILPYYSIRKSQVETGENEFIQTLLLSN